MTVDFAPLRPYVPYKVSDTEREAEQSALDRGREAALKWLAQRGIEPGKSFKPWSGVSRPGE